MLMLPDALALGDRDGLSHSRITSSTKNSAEGDGDRLALPLMLGDIDLLTLRDADPLALLDTD